MGAPKQDLSLRFWSKVDQDEGPLACWPWRTKAVDSDGYGVIKIEGKQQKAHRVAWALVAGEFPRKCVLHRCDNPQCCNPRHLFLGTAGDNNRDRAQKGRSGNPCGERSHNAKLTSMQVKEIRRQYSGGSRYLRKEISQQRLAREYGVSRSQISNILRNKSWRE